MVVPATIPVFGKEKQEDQAFETSLAHKKPFPETNCSTCNENANSEIHLVACQCCTACWIQILTHSNAVRRGCRHFHWADGEVTAQRG